MLHKGLILAERYAPLGHQDTLLESWSLGKSLTATLIGVLMREGRLGLFDAAPVPGWRRLGDPRNGITVADLLRMSSGLQCTSYDDTDLSRSFVPGSLDHLYIYSAPIDVLRFSVTRPLESAAGTVARYRNCDSLALGYILRELTRRAEQDYLSWPQRALFDKIGIRKKVLETDVYGNFVMTGLVYSTARNWARLALLYLRDGVWEGERLLPEGWVDFVSTPGPAWAEPTYGGSFWINGTSEWQLPTTTFYMNGGDVNWVFVVPEHDLAVVRLGHARGADHHRERLDAALGKIFTAITG